MPASQRSDELRRRTLYHQTRVQEERQQRLLLYEGFEQAIVEVVERARALDNGFGVVPNYATRTGKTAYMVLHNTPSESYQSEDGERSSGPTATDIIGVYDNLSAANCRVLSFVQAIRGQCDEDPTVDTLDIVTISHLIRSWSFGVCGELKIAYRRPCADSVLCELQVRPMVVHSTIRESIIIGASVEVPSPRWGGGSDHFQIPLPANPHF
ncbi:hypothetical protein F4819DRAFT_459120 [Hypoxylon fuscum]|nr:hypothetical protein F4819DRAFT_459120 [Hypoxylon fuscum]